MQCIPLIKQRWHDARNSASLDVPEHLRNAPTKLMKDLGFGKDYRYAHDEEDAFAAGETYFPELWAKDNIINQSTVVWSKNQRKTGSFERD